MSLTPEQTNLLVLAVVGLLGAISVYLQARSHAAISDAKDAIQEVHLSLNSRLDQLVESKSAAAHAAGVVEGQSQIINGGAKPPA